MKFATVAATILAGAIGTATARLNDSLQQEQNRKLVAGPAATADSQVVCPNDYSLSTTRGNTAAPSSPLELQSQQTSYVEFDVKQNFVSSTADKIFVQYRGGEDMGEYRCDQYDDVDSVISNLKASCSALQSTAVVDIFVVDNAVSGDAVLPDCCHAGSVPSGKSVKHTYVLECTPTCPSPVSTICPEVVIDFNDLPDYSFIYDEWFDTKGIKFTAKPLVDGNGHTPLPLAGVSKTAPWEDRYPIGSSSVHNAAGGAARVFNTQMPDGDYGANPKCLVGKSYDGDRTLGSPNGGCPSSTPGWQSSPQGPGVGGGGATSSAFSNCPSTLVGNVLIVQEHKGWCPDNPWRGSVLTFDFNPAVIGQDGVDMTYLELLDIPSKKPVIKMWKVGDDLNQAPSTVINTTGGTNALWHKDIDVNNVIRLEFYFPASSSVSQINFVPSSC